MWVKNLEGTTECKPPKGFSSWRHWWAVKKGCVAAEKAGTIPCSKCGKYIGKNGDGGHVCTVPGDGFCYIVPLCDNCNNKEMTDSFEVDERFMHQLPPIKKCVPTFPPIEGRKPIRKGVCIFRYEGACHISEYLKYLEAKHQCGRVQR